MLIRRWPLSLILVAALGAATSGCVSVSIDREIQASRHQLQVEPIDLQGPDQTKARITAEGRLWIAGQAIDLTPAQRDAVMAYRGEVIAFADRLLVDTNTLTQHAMSNLVFNALIGRGEQAAKDLDNKVQTTVGSPATCERLQRVRAAKRELDQAVPAVVPYDALQDTQVSRCPMAS